MRCDGACVWFVVSLTLNFVGTQFCGVCYISEAVAWRCGGPKCSSAGFLQELDCLSGKEITLAQPYKFGIHHIRLVPSLNSNRGIISFIDILPTTISTFIFSAVATLPPWCLEGCRSSSLAGTGVKSRFGGSCIVCDLNLGHSMEYLL